YDKELLVVVLNTLGKQLYSKVMVTDTNKFTIEAVDSYTRLAPGVYYIVASSNSNLFHKKLVIR
ncbi:MAG: T9SS type A sorting domain-containing protein, partial [Bacteroidales bacterium]